MALLDQLIYASMSSLELRVASSRVDGNGGIHPHHYGSAIVEKYRSSWPECSSFTDAHGDES
jgi:hypothetical protein